MAVISAGEDGEAFGWGFALPRDWHPAASAWDNLAVHSKTCLSSGLLHLRVNSGAALIWIKRSKDSSWLFLNSCGWNILGDLPSFFSVCGGMAHDLSPDSCPCGLWLLGHCLCSVFYPCKSASGIYFSLGKACAAAMPVYSQVFLLAWLRA